MSAEIPAEALQLRLLVRADQTLELFLDMVPVPQPGPDEVVIRVEAAPLETDGRTELLKVLGQDEPPRVIRCGSCGCSYLSAGEAGEWPRRT